jgi:hypothetical protein
VGAGCGGVGCRCVRCGVGWGGVCVWGWGALPASAPRRARCTCTCRATRPWRPARPAQVGSTLTNNLVPCGNKYSDLKLRMGPSESSCPSSRFPKKCGRASEVWSGARSARLTLRTRAHRGAFGRSARSNTKSFKKRKTQKKLGQVGGRVSAGMSERASALNAHKQ